MRACTVPVQWGWRSRSILRVVGAEGGAGKERRSQGQCLRVLVWATLC